ncbi:conserved uncharacterized protein, DUF2219 [Desulfosarcina variabilis str. Montpellier]|uniref:lipid A deacylase LpxR family protein n=1 Tax=Desulfosarcina variabilis TaxID=2300 RepID=UPI003AFA844D
MVKILQSLFAGFLFLLAYRMLFAGDFNINSIYNKATLRFEIDNDAVWKKDSDFTNGWSLQYHSVRYASWEETGAPGWLTWMGRHFPGLGDDNSIVGYSHGIGQNMITPGDLTNSEPLEGDLPYAGTLTYSLNWQCYNQQTARTFQVSVGILGTESLAGEFQNYVHDDLSMGDDPQGWETQRDTEPIINFGYAYIRLLADMGTYTNDWAGQIFLAPMGYFGNLITGVDLVLGLRLGWNIQEGFNVFPAPPGYGFFGSHLVPKPETASPHCVELVLTCKSMAMIYSAFFDGSVITDDDRDVDRETFAFAGMIGLNYYYYKMFSIRIAILHETDMLVEDSLPVGQAGKDNTGTDNSYGALLLDFYF